MNLQNTISKIRAPFAELPGEFWVVTFASFIDQLGGKLVYPFFTLYITAKFGIGMTQAGVLLMVWSFSGFLGSFIGGALSDRFGRKVMVLFGLVFSAVSSIGIGLATELWMMYFLAFFVGVLSDIAGPAWQAMVADILPENQRTEGFGVMRVTGNLAWIIGPTIGGLLSTYSFLLLFVLDAISSIITALVIYRHIPETKPEISTPDEQKEPLIKTVAGYTKVFGDKLFMAFILASMMALVVYLQMYSTLSVYLRDHHGFSTQLFGYLLTSSAIMVVIFQFWISRQVKKYPPMLMMALGSAFYAVGFTMFGFVATYALFVLAIILITIGEMVDMPVSQKLAADFAPEDMRGRYMAVFGLSWAIPAMFGPIAAGYILDNLNPNLLWYAGGVICVFSMFGFILLNQATRRRFQLEIDTNTLSA